jgi:ATP-dependent Clp protease ATP-binding subunit ClpC
VKSRKLNRLITAIAAAVSQSETAKLQTATAHASAKYAIVDKTCVDRSYGARPLRRAMQKYIEDPLSEAVIQGRIGAASIIEVFLDGENLNHRPLLAEELDTDEVLIH